MQEDKYNLGVKSAEGDMYPAGIAKVVLPTDIDRSIYIAECLRTSTVSIFSEHNGFNNRVPIDKYSIQFIDFPLTVHEFGTPVAFQIDPIHKKPIIIGIYSNDNEVCDLKENQFKFRRELNGNFVEIVGSPDGRYIGINVTGDKAGRIDIAVKSIDESASVNISVDGDVNIQSLNRTNLKQYVGLNSTTVNRTDKEEFASFEQDTLNHTFYDKGHQVNTEKLSINDGSEPWILGKKWAQFMKDFIQEVGSSTVTTALGQMPLLNAEKITAYQDKVDELLSQIAFIDK